METRAAITFEQADIEARKDPLMDRLARFPWWFVGIVIIVLGAYLLIAIADNYREAFQFIIWPGIQVTIFTSLIAYSIALIIGLIAGLGRISGNVVFTNLATMYVEIVRGIPMLVLIFYIALVAVPDASQLLGFSNQAVPQNVRAIIALAVTYGAFLAEIFRAGIQSIGKGQMEAARSLGMSYGQAMRFIILPQAIRNMLPALGNDFVAMVKDSSLVSVLAVRDITQVARIYAGSSFRFREAYTTLAILYLSMVLVLSLGVRLLERQLRRDER